MRAEEYVEEGVGENVVVVVTSTDKDTTLEVSSVDSVLLSSTNDGEEISIASSDEVGDMK